MQLTVNIALMTIMAMSILYAINYFAVVLRFRHLRRHGGDVPENIELFTANTVKQIDGLKYLITSKPSDNTLMMLVILLRVVFVVLMILWILLLMIVGLSWLDAAIRMRQDLSIPGSAPHH